MLSQRYYGRVMVTCLQKYSWISDPRLGVRKSDAQMNSPLNALSNKYLKVMPYPVFPFMSFVTTMVSDI